jgi:hypothetical protein
MRKYKKARLEMEARIQILKERGFGISKNGMKVDPESREYRKELEMLLGTLPPQSIELLLSRKPPKPRLKNVTMPHSKKPPG